MTTRSVSVTSTHMRQWGEEQIIIIIISLASETSLWIHPRNKTFNAIYRRHMLCSYVACLLITNICTYISLYMVKSLGILLMMKNKQGNQKIELAKKCSGSKN